MCQALESNESRNGPEPACDTREANVRSFRSSGILIAWCLGFCLGGSFGLSPPQLNDLYRWRSIADLLKVSDAVILVEASDPCLTDHRHQLRIFELIHGDWYDSCLELTFPDQGSGNSRTCPVQSGDLYLVFLHRQAGQWRLAAGGHGVFKLNHPEKRLEGQGKSKSVVELHGRPINDSIALIKKNLARESASAPTVNREDTGDTFRSH